LGGKALQTVLYGCFIVVEAEVERVGEVHIARIDAQLGQV